MSHGITETIVRDEVDDGESRAVAGRAGSGVGEHAPARAAEASEARSGGEAAALGSTQSNCTTIDSVERRRVRWAARAALWRASTLYAVRTCGVHLAPVIDEAGTPLERSRVDVKRGGSSPVAGFGGLTLCGSVWACPRCSGVIAFHRSAEIARAVSRCLELGGQVHFLTLTLRHARKDRLSDLFDVLAAGWRRAFGSTAWTGERKQRRGRRESRVGDRDLFGVVGYTRVVEATFGANGWHLHLHVLLYTSGGLSAGVRSDAQAVLGRMFGHEVAVDREWLGRILLQARIFSRWAEGLARAGGRAPGAAAVDLRTIADHGAEFIGGYLAKSTYDAAAGLGAEIAAGELTKTSTSRTPFALLWDLVTSGPRFGIRTPRRWEIIEEDDAYALVDRDTGEISRLSPPGDWARWVEWELTTRGRKQLTWARVPSRSDTSARAELWRSIQSARGEDAEADDEELARRDIDGVILGGIGREDWYGSLVWQPSALVDLLETAENSGAWGVSRWMRDRGLDYSSR